MTGAGALWLVAILLVGGAIGIAVRRFMAGKAARAVVVFVLLLPLLLYYGWGISDGCVLAEASSQEDAERCFGFGFGLVVGSMLFMPPWIIGIALGYMNPWTKSGN